MKKLSKIGMAIVAILMLASCGSTKNTAVQSKIEKSTSLEGEKVRVETVKLYGVDMMETLSEDGMKITKVPYRWYAGIATSDKKEDAVDMARLEANVTISRVIENMVMANAERSSLVNNGEVQKALTSHWKQVSMSIQNACEPIGDTKIEYDPSQRMYTATTKIGIRGDRYQQLLNSAGNFKPKNLSGADLEQFTKTNQTIINAAKGN